MMGDEFIREKVSETSSEDISTYHWKIIKWVYVTHQASAAGQAKVKGGIGTGRLDDEGSELLQTVTSVTSFDAQTESGLVLVFGIRMFLVQL